MGFRLYLKWGFPVQSNFITESPSKLYSTSSKGREISFDSARVSLTSPSTIYDEGGETIYNDAVKACTCSSTFQTVENSQLELEEIKAVGRGDDSTSNRSLRASSMLCYSLLMENLGILEETVSDCNLSRLERDILAQLGRLGALKLFHTCLSRTLDTSHSLDLSNAPTSIIEDCQIESPVDHGPHVVVRSGKKEERKLRRERALVQVNENTALLFPKKSLRKILGRPSVSSAKRISSSRRKRLTLARNEAEISKGVKMVANLERIRETVEKEIGRAATLSCWAEAAGIDKKALKQQLHFGWHCRDELIRSTRSLVVYVAKNYKTTGVAFEDLLLAGCVGVLQGAERFDHTRGYKFSTYVQYWIRKSMSTLVARHARGIHTPPLLNKAINQILNARKAFYSNHGKYPDDEEIAEFTGLSVAKIQSASKCLRVVGSVDQKVGKCHNVKFTEFIPDTSMKSPEKKVMQQHMRKDIHNLLSSLNSRERQVLALRYGLGDHQRKSLEEVGRIFHVSKEWIRKIERTALSKLKSEEICNNLSYYLDL